MRIPLPRRRSGEPPEDVNLLELTPVRLVGWSEIGDRVVVERPRGSAPKGPFARLRSKLAGPRLRLDPIGSYAWLRLDGSRTVAALAAELRAEFGESVEPAEQRLGELVRRLRRERRLGYPGWDALENRQAGTVSESG